MAVDGNTIILKLAGSLLLIDGAIAIALKNDTSTKRIMESAAGFVLVVA